MLFESKNTPVVFTPQKLQKKLVLFVGSCFPYFLLGSKDLEEPEPEALSPVGVESSIQSNSQTNIQ